MGQNIINPTATIFSAAMMLEYLGYVAESERLISAIEKVYADAAHLTPDQAGTASTTQFCDVVSEYLR